MKTELPESVFPRSLDDANRLSTRYVTSTLFPGIGPKGSAVITSDIGDIVNDFDEIRDRIDDLLRDKIDEVWVNLPDPLDPVIHQGVTKPGMGVAIREQAEHLAEMMDLSAGYNDSPAGRVSGVKISSSLLGTNIRQTLEQKKLDLTLEKRNGIAFTPKNPAGDFIGQLSRINVKVKAKTALTDKEVDQVLGAQMLTGRLGEAVDMLRSPSSVAFALMESGMLGGSADAHNSLSRPTSP